MTFRLRANSDQRRRRVLLEETRTEEGMPEPPRPSRRTRRYPDDTLREAQPRVTDFLCSRWSQVAGIVVTFLVVDVSLLLAAWLEPAWSARWPELPLDLIAARYGDSLMGVSITLQLALATATCAVLFGIRRRRLDDLRGTYQVWIWSTALVGLLTLISALEVEPLTVMGLRRIPRFPQFAISHAYLWAPLLAVFSPWVARMLIEMRRSRAAQFALVGACVLVCASEAIRCLSLRPDLVRLVSIGLAMVASTLLLLSLLSYGRHVKLEARGNLGEDGRPKKKKRKKRVQTEDEEEEYLDSVDDLSSRRRIDPRQPLRGRRSA